MDLETISIVACCLFVCIGIPALIIRHRNKKKAKAEAEAARKATAAKKAKTASTASAKKASEKKAPDKTESSKKTGDKKPVSRVKTDPAFSGAGDLTREKPKPAPEKKKATAKPQTDMETETLLKLDRGSKDCWKCRFCGAENVKPAGRCVVCGQEKHPSGL